jgi:hypothetical protein
MQLNPQVEHLGKMQRLLKPAFQVFAHNRSRKVPTAIRGSGCGKNESVLPMRVLLNNTGVGIHPIFKIIGFSSYNPHVEVTHIGDVEGHDKFFVVRKSRTEDVLPLIYKYFDRGGNNLQALCSLLQTLHELVKHGRAG